MARDRIARALLADAVDSAGNGIVIADARRDDMPLIFVNPAFERITGYASAEALGRNCRFLQGGETRQTGLSSLRRALTVGRACQVTLRNFRKDGKPFWNELYVAPIRDAAGVSHFVGVQNDVTRRIRAEQAETRLRNRLRAQTRELRALNDQKNALLGMAAHDIRNPLTTVMLCADMLRKQGRPDARMLNRIKDSARFMLQIVNDLLDVSKIESGKLDLALKPCDLRALIAERVSVYRQSAEAKGIALRSRCPAGLPPARADRARIAQVLDNLISNAVKFSYPETRVRVTARRDGGTLEVSVSDQGQGIPEAERQRLFQPFARTSVRGTAGESSTGLGLAICRKIVEAHPGGQIGVHSEVGKGSTFSFRLPVHG